MRWRRQAEPVTEAQKVCRLLNSRKPKENEWAKHRLRRFGPDSVQELLEALVHERAYRKKRKIQYCVGAILILLTMIHWHLYGNWFYLIGAISTAFAATQAQKSIALTLAQIEDVRTVGALAEALDYKDKQVVRPAELALVRLLPRLKASDAALLDIEQRAALYRALGRNRPELVVAILRALEQVGDSQALPAVQKLADGQGWAAQDIRIRPLAQELLPILTRRSGEERSRQTLLRAASAGGAVTTPPEMLLRPANGDNRTGPHELLRSTADQTDIALTESETVAQTPSTATSSRQENEEPAVVMVGRYA